MNAISFAVSSPSRALHSPIFSAILRQVEQCMNEVCENSKFTASSPHASPFPWIPAAVASHSYKDRPPSGHADLARQPSSPAPQFIAEPKELYYGAARDLTSLGYGISEKEGGDTLLSSPDRGRSSSRRSFGFERVERHRDWKTERPPAPLRNLDKDSAETGTVSRKTGDGHNKHEVSEGVSSTSLYRERAPPKKAYDGYRGDIRQRECDLESSKSPKGFSLSSDAFKFSSKRLGFGFVDRDGSTQHSSRRKTDHVRSSHLSPKDKEYVDDMDDQLLKAMVRAIKEGAQDKEQAATFDDTHTMSLSVPSKSRSGRGDVMKDDQCHGTNRDCEDAPRERAPPPLSFSHVSKRVRSDRDRGRREDAKLTIRCVHSMVSFSAEASAKKLDIDEVLVKGNWSLPQNRDTAEDERHLDKMDVEGPILNKWNDSDVEEGELEPESHLVNRAGELVTTSPPRLDNKEGKKSDDAPIVAKEEKEACEGILSVVRKAEKQLDACGDHAQDKVDMVSDTKDLNIKFSSGNGIINLQLLSHSPTKVLEVTGEGSKGELTLEMLDHTREEAKMGTFNAAGKGHDSDKNLILSLFTKPGAVAVGAGTGLEENTSEGGAAMKAQQNGEQAHNSELGIPMGRPHFGLSGERSSQHSDHGEKKLNVEGLQLSLAPPGTSVEKAGSDPLPWDLAKPERSFHSLGRSRTHNHSPSQTYTNSDGFTSSFSFSQSHSFLHNPSCSLNCTSVENQELSCGGSRQVSQGTEQMSHRSWPSFSGNEHTITSVSRERSRSRRGIPLYQRGLQNGNVPQGFPSVTGSNRSSGSNHISQRSHHFGQWLQDAPRILDLSLPDLEVSTAKKTSTPRDIMERVRQQKAWFASRQQAMAREPRPEPSSPTARNRLVDAAPSNVKGTTFSVKEGASSVLSDRIGLHEITTEPIATMAQKLQELPDSFLEGLKGVAKGVLGSFGKRNAFIALQENIRKRTDLTEESLLRANRTQLEILVALKMSMQAYVQEGSKPQTYKALIEIFLQTKCRNIACQQSLPVFGCECKICSKKGGFCHECMCIVCFKFDTEFDTCRWVRCDVCLHWCHMDCGLRMSYIAPTSSATASEMQYHCAACEHKSQLFGFIKEVFQKCAEGWCAETLAKELDCVRKIFHGSQDMRGKQLCWQAEQMLQKLENKVGAAEVCRSMLWFFSEGNAELDGACGPNKKSTSSKLNEASAKLADRVREVMPKTTSSGGSKLANMEKACAPIHKTFDRSLEDKGGRATVELQYDPVCKRAEIEDIESVVRMKQAEAKMFQARADEARQEARGLQRIIGVNHEKVNDVYAWKYAKLRLNEAEERQRKWLKELKVLETAQQEFQKMKLHMEAEIKELIVKMEMAKRQFT